MIIYKEEEEEEDNFYKKVAFGNCTDITAKCFEGSTTSSSLSSLLAKNNRKQKLTLENRKYLQSLGFTVK